MKALSKSLQILNEFCRAVKPLGVSEVADALGMNRSMVSKTLSTFREEGFLHQDRTSRKYSPDAKCFLLGSAFINQCRISQLGAGIIRRLAEETGHSAMICNFFGDEVLELAVMDGRDFVDARLQRGTLMPAYATASGQVLLAFASPERQKSVMQLPLTAITDKTLSTTEALSSRLTEVRERGYSITRGESLAGLGAIAVPIYEREGGVTAALCLAFPDHSSPPDRDPSLVSLLHGNARRLSMTLGAPVYPFGNSGDVV